MLAIKYIQCFDAATFFNQKSLFYSILSETEITDIDTYKNAKRKIEHLLGIVLIRLFLSELLSISPKDILFENKKNGKPFCKNFPNIHFNISHSGNYVVAALSDSSVGVDIESLKKNAPMQVAERFFNEKEWKILNETPVKEKKSIFFKFWTAKESYVKMLGDGLTKSLSSFYVLFENEKTTIFDEGEKRSCFINFFLPDESHIISTCSENEQNIYYQEVTIEDILFKLRHGIV